MTTNPYGKGFTTSEFIGTMVSMGIGLLVLTQVIPDQQAKPLTDALSLFFQDLVKLIADVATIYLMVKPLMKYIESRTELKKQMIDQAETPQV